jgi:hypothetical protein
MTNDTVERMALLMTEMDRAGELNRVKFLWYDIPDPRLQQLMFKTLGFSFDMNKSNPMHELSMAIKRYQAKSKHETIDELWKHARASWACKRWSAPPRSWPRS